MRRLGSIGATVFVMMVSLVVGAEPLTIERIYTSPSISGPTVSSLALSPDGERITFLKGKERDAQQLDLWEFDAATGEQRLLFDSDRLNASSEVLSDEEKARRERLRLRGSGIVSYQWTDDGRSILFPLGGDAYLYDVGADQVVQLLDTPAFETDLKISPKGNYLSFIREQDLYVLNLASGEETKLSHDGGGTIRNGMAEFVAQEEMSRMTGYWWSPDEAHIAYTRTDDSGVAVATRNEIYADRVETIEQRYPWAGTANVEINLAVAKIDGSHTVWIDLGEDKDIYLARVNWRDSKRLTYQWQNRAQNRLELRQYHLAEQHQSLLLAEQSDTWVNLDGNLTFIDHGERFIWASERDGFNHLYLYGGEGELIRQLTEGDWIVDQLETVDVDNDTFYFSGRKDSVLERHLYRAFLAEPSNVKRLTERSGMHSVTFSSDASHYIDNFSSVTVPPQVSLHEANGNFKMWINENKVDRDHPLAPFWSDMIQPEFGTTLADDGKTVLYYRLYKPADLDETKTYPALVFLYGGPGSQQVKNSWGNLFLQYMAQQGYAVITLDNRGSFGRGLAFESAIHLRTGDVEVRDQVKAVEVLGNLGWVDTDRVGVFGYSYGGYMTLMAMMTAPEHFAAGAAGGSVTDWRLYDTHYTERYMGHPEENVDGYAASSVMPYIDNLRGELFIYHGMADDNVLFTNSTQIYRALQERMIPFWAMDYPGEKHGMRDFRTRIHQHKMLERFFDNALKFEN